MCQRSFSTARRSLPAAPSAAAERTVPLHSSWLPPAKAQRAAAEEQPAAPAHKPRQWPVRPERGLRRGDAVEIEAEEGVGIGIEANLGVGGNGRVGRA